jgi:hypothetical protein
MTTKEKAVGQRDEKVGAEGGALKEKTRLREMSKTNCAMFHFIISMSAGRRDDFRGPRVHHRTREETEYVKPGFFSAAKDRVWFIR